MKKLILSCLLLGGLLVNAQKNYLTGFIFIPTHFNEGFELDSLNIFINSEEDELDDSITAIPLVDNGKALLYATFLNDGTPHSDTLSFTYHNENVESITSIGDEYSSQSTLIYEEEKVIAELSYDGDELKDSIVFNYENDILQSQVYYDAEGEVEMTVNFIYENDLLIGFEIGEMASELFYDEFGNLIRQVVKEGDNELGNVYYHWNSSVVTDIKRPNPTKILDFYPNPATDVLYVNTKGNVFIYNANGQLVKNVSSLNNNSIDLTELNAGVYYLVDENGAGNKLIVK